MRLPFADEFRSLDMLREASESVGLPAVQLLALCFVAATKEAESALGAARDESPKGGKAAGTPTSVRKRARADKDSAGQDAS